MKFVSGQNVPSQMQGIHFHVYSSGTLLDFVTPAATITNKECSLSALDLGSLRWQKLAEGREIFKPGYRWHYCTMNEDGTKAWLFRFMQNGRARKMGLGPWYSCNRLVMKVRERPDAGMAEDEEPEFSAQLKSEMVSNAELDRLIANSEDILSPKASYERSKKLSSSL